MLNNARKFGMQHRRALLKNKGKERIIFHKNGTFLHPT